MQAHVQGFEPVGQLHSLSFDSLAIDYWRVQGHSQARGYYVSDHPRFVVFLKDSGILISKDSHPSAQPCACCYIPPGVEIWSRLARAGELAHVDIHLPMQKLRQMADEGLPLHEPLLLTDPGLLPALAQTLADECIIQQRSPAHVEMLAGAAIAEMFHSDRSHMEQEALFDDVLHNYVMDNLERRISVGQLASMAGMSRTNFTRMCRERTGQPPYRWVMALRIDHAKDMMRTGMPLAAIASATGFSDQAHFNRVFKSMTGSAPGLWMKESRTDHRGAIVQDGC